jgi:hypothetical protein
MDTEIIQTCKSFIETNDVQGIQTYYCDLLWTEFPRDPDWPFIFHKVYLHACLKGREDIANWLTRALYPNMDQIQQIALRQIFPYGRLLLARAKRRSNPPLPHEAV